MASEVMSGTCLRFYVHENRRLHHVLLYDWLLETANRLGIHGGSAFRAIAGFGRHGVIHEQHFFELAGDLTVEVEFLVTDEEADRLIQVIKAERVRIFFARSRAEYGVLGEDEPSARP